MNDKKVTAETKLLFFIVTGRVCGEEEDGAEIFEAVDSDDAREQFNELLSDRANGREIYITTVASSETPITLE